MAQVWTPRNWTGWTALQIVGAGTCVIAWSIADDKLQYNQQTGMIVVSILGLALSVAAHGWVLVHGRARLRARRREMLGAPVRRRAGASDVAHAATAVVAGAGSSFYHRPSCTMAAGRDWALSTVMAQESSRRTPCRVCAP